MPPRTGILAAAPRLVLAALTLAPFSAAAGDSAVGTWLLRGDARVQVSPFPARTQPGRMTLTVTPTPRTGEVSVKLETEGRECSLPGSVGRDGSLDLSPRARCEVEVREPEARGRVDARLRSGHGTVRDGRLTLDLVFEVSGEIATHVARTRITWLGADVVVPEGWTPAVPVSGTVSTRATGGRRTNP